MDCAHSWHTTRLVHRGQPGFCRPPESVPGCRGWAKTAFIGRTHRQPQPMEGVVRQREVRALGLHGVGLAGQTLGLCRLTPPIWFLLTLAFTKLPGGTWHAANPLAQILLRMLLPCQLLLFGLQPAAYAAAGVAAVPWDVLAAGLVWGVISIIAGAMAGLQTAHTLTSLWHLPRDLQRYLDSATSRTTSRTAASSSRPPASQPEQPGQPWQRLIDWVVVGVATWWGAVAGWGGRRLGLRAGGGAEGSIARAVASALGSPAAAPALLPPRSDPPPWLPCALACVGAAAATWLATSTHLLTAPLAPAAALHVQLDQLAASQPHLLQLLAATLHAPCWAAPMWVLSLPGVTYAADSLAAVVDSAAFSWWLGQGWTWAVLVGQSLCIWGGLFPWLVKQLGDKGPATAPKEVNQRPWLGPADRQGTRGGPQDLGGGLGLRGSMDVVDGRVWVRVGDKQEVLLTPRELAQLVPFNTPLPGSLRVAGGGGEGQGSGRGGEGSQASMASGGSMEEEEIVAAEVRDVDSGSGLSGSSGEEGTDADTDDGATSSFRGQGGAVGGDGEYAGGKVGGRGWRGVLRRVERAVAFSPPLTGLLVGVGVMVVLRLLTGATAAADLPAAVLLQEAQSAGASLQGAGVEIGVLDIGVGTGGLDMDVAAAVEELMQPTLTPTTSLPEDASIVVDSMLGFEGVDESDLVIAVDGEPDLGPGPSSLESGPWDWWAVQRVLGSCMACVCWAGAAGPVVLSLHAVLLLHAAINGGAGGRQGQGSRRGPTPPAPSAFVEPALRSLSLSKAWAATEGARGAQEVWKGLAGSLQVAGANSLVSAATRLLLPMSSQESCLLAGAMVTALFASPAAIMFLDRLAQAGPGLVYAFSQAAQLPELGAACLHALHAVQAALTAAPVVPMLHTGVTIECMGAVQVLLAAHVACMFYVGRPGDQTESAGPGELREAFLSAVALALIRAGLLWALLRPLLQSFS